MALSQSFESFLVVGGSGFLGNAIVKALLARGEPSVAVYNLVQRHFEGNVQVFRGDITDEISISDAIRKCGATCVIHTASPVHGLESEIYWKVNVEGTRTLLTSAAANHVCKFIFTSSTGVVYTGEPFDGVDEGSPIPVNAYHETKAKAEALVLLANEEHGMRTVALRPSGMFGPDDRQVMPGVAKSVREGKTHIQIGDNTNVVDWAYVDNVADAHLLAADKLSSNSDSDGVSGQAFFITNGRPILYWDFLRLIWRALEDPQQGRQVVKLPGWLAMKMARAIEFWAWLIGTKPSLTRYNVIYATTTHWYNIEKARNVLGYDPKVSVEDGVLRMVKWWKDEGERRYEYRE